VVIKTGITSIPIEDYPPLPAGVRPPRGTTPAPAEGRPKKPAPYICPLCRGKIKKAAWLRVMQEALTKMINPQEFGAMLGIHKRTASELMIKLAAQGAYVIDTGGGKSGRCIRSIALKDAVEYKERHRITATQFTVDGLQLAVDGKKNKK
jgi:hypothetical protein